MNQNLYDATVIIPVYNRSHHLILTLDSIIQQKLSKYKIEVIICDDGSIEDIYSIVKRYKTKLDIKYLYQEDLGFRVAKARNMGITSAIGDICIFIDNGIILEENCIKNHIETHRMSERNAAVIGYVYGFDLFNMKQNEVEEIILQNSISKAIELLQRGGMIDSREKLYQELGDDLSCWPAPWVVFWTCNVSVKTSVLREIGMFDENFQSWGGEDNDLGIRLQLNHVNYILRHDIKSIHYPHEKLHQYGSVPEVERRKQLEKKKYIYSKYPIESVSLWITDGLFKINKILIAREERLNE